MVLGAGDGPLGNLGVGALEPGVVGLSLGTSGAVRMITDRPYVDAAGRPVLLQPGRGGVGARRSGQQRRHRGCALGGRCVRVDFADDAGGHNPDGMLLDLARDVPIGSEELVMLPFLMAERAPLWIVEF